MMWRGNKMMWHQKEWGENWRESKHRIWTPLSSSTAHNQTRLLTIHLRQTSKLMEKVDQEPRKLPLSEVVSDCVRRWFQETLKEAKGGDFNMQVLLGQMYNNGYGVSKDANKGKLWMTRASRVRSSVWKVSDKRPGYNASDSDSDGEA